MCNIHELVKAGGLESWSDARLMTSLAPLQLSRGVSDWCEALVLAELARRGRSPETMFGSKLTASEALRRTKTAVALSDGSLPGAAATLAAGDATLAHVNALAELKERLPEGAAAKLLPLAKKLAPDKFRRAALKLATPVEEIADGSTGQSSRGGRWFRFSFDGREGTIVLNGLETVMNHAWRRDHPERAEEKLERPAYGQRLAEALLEMARDALAGRSADDSSADADTADGCGGPDGPSPDGPPPSPKRGKPVRAVPEIIIVIGFEKMFRDAEAAGICTTIDGVPLPVDVVREMLVDAKIYPLVVGGDGEVLDFGRSRRFFSTAQKKAAAARDMSCGFADCDRPVRYADYHHCTPYSEGGPTDIANEIPACPQCHDKLTNHGYRIERRGGVTYTYGPDGQLIHQRNNRWQK